MFVLFVFVAVTNTVVCTSGTTAVSSATASCSPVTTSPDVIVLPSKRHLSQVFLLCFKSLLLLPVTFALALDAIS